MNPDLRVSRTHCGLSSPTDSSFTPESCRLLLLRSSSLRLEDWELRTEDRTSQLVFDSSQPLILERKKGRKRRNFYIEQLTDMTGNGPEVKLEPWAAAEDKDSVHGAHALPTELQEHPRGSHF